MSRRRTTKSRVVAEQLTVRGVPPQVARALRKRAVEEGKSLNAVLVETLAKDVEGLADPRFTDLSDLAGAWQDDPQCEAALAAQDQIDESLWR